MAKLSLLPESSSVVDGPIDFRRSAAMNESTSAAIYQARLTETGLAVEDSIALCSEYCSASDWLEVKSKALKENLLGKGSRSRISKLLRAVGHQVIYRTDDR